MSLNSMTNDALRRQVTIHGQKVHGPLESAAALSPAALPEASAVTAVDDNSANKVVNALIKYIPTEMLASFLAAVSIAPTLSWSVERLYVIWIIATPLVFLLIYYSKLASAGDQWPSFSSAAFKRVAYLALAATVAFIIWGLSVPTNIVSKDIAPILSAFLAGIASPLLSILEPIVYRIIGQ